ncbi:hypothetical protein ACMFMG_008323 [Clarireedia jacksonii]
MISTSISYDKAGVTPLVVGSNKSIVGVGNGDVITGKGLHLPNTSKNVIIQKVHITNINSGSVWGGGGLMLDGNADVWIDHCKFSKVGRMFIVYDFNANTVAISNTKFDSVITTSATYSKTHTGAPCLSPTATKLKLLSTATTGTTCQAVAPSSVTKAPPPPSK